MRSSGRDIKDIEDRIVHQHYDNGPFWTYEPCFLGADQEELRVILSMDSLL